MIETLDAIIARLRVEHPTIRRSVDNVVEELGPEEYDATIVEWAQIALAQQVASDAETQSRSVRDQVRQALSVLSDDRTQLDTDYAAIVDTSVSMTGNQLRPYIARMNRIMRHMSVTQSGLIRTLIDRAMIEPE